MLAELAPVLRDVGLLQSLADRALEKTDLLSSDTRPAVREAPADLLSWHFARLEVPVPEDVESYSRAIGFPGSDALVLAIARERWYLHHRRQR